MNDILAAGVFIVVVLFATASLLGVTRHYKWATRAWKAAVIAIISVIIISILTVMK